MELLYWPPEKSWGLPSFDIDSLHVLAFIKFADAPVSLVPTYKSWLARKGYFLPCLRSASNEFYQPVEKILSYLKLKYYDPDTWLAKEARECVFPLGAVIEDKLLPAVLAIFWLDAASYGEVTRPLYAKNCQYPLNFSYPNKLHSSIESRIKALKLATDEEVPKLADKLYSDAAEAMRLFSDMLGNQDFLLGSRPASIDAFLFAVLAPLLKAPLQNCKLQNRLRGTANLCQYLNRILSTYFKDDQRMQEPESAASEEDFTTYDWLVPVSVATVAMLSYAINAGLMQATRGT